jgi:hypothetical protein
LFNWQWTATIIMQSLLAGLITGVLQWLVLRRYIEGIAWWTWTLAVAAVGLVSYPLELAISFASSFLFVCCLPAVFSVVAGALTGRIITSLLAGALQWLVLQRHLRGAAVWVLAVVGSAILGHVIGSVPVLAIQAGGPMPDTALYSVLSFLVGTPIVASITGFTLLWLVNRTRRSNWTYETS